ncbi:hypothetical protein BCR33DRAFT_841603 [Rhizoclosmatium globosum]|uniref:Glycosyl transferase family 1 domain-containing protein n=1 Tax=Rhizoclosmatium globosum TaxID=329046 RepID=A0A1Y2B9A7_9FUNG|nr:hypothetical protein BCR33DRAFT_841603 [Rhizoclosmatium globosum]|eukprot:ORY30675.1 hypothetical protein BCR33DRAFT_841603 [Rhizoclosmatium globosum]
MKLITRIIALLLLLSLYLFVTSFFQYTREHGSLVPSPHQSPSFPFASKHFGSEILYPINRTSGFSLEELLDLCHDGESLTITRNWAIRGSEEALADNYLASCFPLEASVNQAGRSMGHCSDFVQYIYHANARLTLEFKDKAVFETKAKVCPRSTYLHGEFVQRYLFEPKLKLRNYWLPNVEQIDWGMLPLYETASRVLCKTKITCVASQAYLRDKKILSTQTKFMSHSSPDARKQGVELLGEKKASSLMQDSKRFDRFYHAYGKSGRKNTDDLLHCWYGHPKWPKLTVVGHHPPWEFVRKHYRGMKHLPKNIEILSSVSIQKLRELQLSHGVHLCPSQQEGYGHYINEARALGALVMTTDYPPMNEFVEDGISGILMNHEPPYPESHQGLQQYFVSPVRVATDSICAAVEKVLKMSLDERRQMGIRAREAYERDTNEMITNLTELESEANAFLHATLQATMAALRTLATNQRNSSGSPSLRTPKVDLVVSPKGEYDIVLDAKTVGICCRVEPKDQTLRLIEITSFALPLSFKGQEIGSAPTLRAILKRFGPTYPGHICPNSGDFVLGYPGIAFVFKVPEGSSADLLLATPSEKSPVATRIYLFNPAASLTSVSIEAIKSAAPVELNTRTWIHAVPGRGLTFPSSSTSIPFNSPAQDVLMILGQPSDIFYKTLDTATNAESGDREYPVWNYFQLGLDVVMDVTGSMVERFVLHCNTPTHYSFGRYVKARFRMLLSHDGDRGHLIDASSSYNTVQKLLGPTQNHMVYNKAMGSSPFGGSEFFAYEGLIFEVVEGNQVASVVMFRV